MLDKLTIRSDLVQFEQFLCFSKIEGSIIPEFRNSDVTAWLKKETRTD